MGLSSNTSRKNYCNESIVYHYCSLETFIKIIQKPSLRMTNIIKSNDNMEIAYSLKEARAATLSILTNCGKKFPKVQETIENVSFDELFDEVIEKFNLSYYAVCFSGNGDLLSQWRGYGNDGTGVALGFNAYYLSKLSLKESNFQYQPMNYGAEEIWENTQQNIAKNMKKICSKHNYTTSDIENILFNIVSDAIYTAAFSKHHAFREEEEYRLVYFPFGDSRGLQERTSHSDDISNNRYIDKMLEHFQHDNHYGGFALSEPRFRVQNKQLVSYFELSFNEIKDVFLSEIVLGPKTKMNDSDLKLLLMSQGYDLNYLNIRQSDAPYQ